MPCPRSAKPTDGELEFLQILWRNRVFTICDEHDELIKFREFNQSQSAKHAAAAASTTTKQEILKDLTNQLLRDSPQNLAQRFMQPRNHSAEKRARLVKFPGEWSRTCSL